MFDRMDWRSESWMEGLAAAALEAVGVAGVAAAAAGARS